MRVGYAHGKFPFGVMAGVRAGREWREGGSRVGAILRA